MRWRKAVRAEELRDLGGWGITGFLLKQPEGTWARAGLERGRGGLRC